MSHRDRIVDVTVGRLIARFASGQQDCEIANLNQPGHHLRENIPSGMLTSLKRSPALGYLSLWCLTGAHGAPDSHRCSGASDLGTDH